MKGQRIVRNVVALIASQPLTWALTLAFTVLVPRNVGPREWGEWTIAMAVGSMATVVFDLGVNTVLLKGVARYPDDSERAVGAVLTLRLLMTPLLVVAMVGFSMLAGYSPHTRLIVAVMALSVAINSVAASAMAGLQAFERMHLTALATVLVSLILTVGAFVMVKLLTLGVISIGGLAVASQLVGLVLQVVWLNQRVRLRPVLDLQLALQLLQEGLPYWVTRGLFTLYVLVDGLMLSVMAGTHENGWYGVAGQLASVPGFLIGAMTTAVLPALSRTVVEDGQVDAEIVGRSFRLLITLSLPMAVGLALVSGNAVPLLFGAWFSPAAPVLAILAATIPAVFVATLINTCLVAADRQLQWTRVMGGLTALNIGLNLFTIPFFHAHYGNGALGAALALLVTDCASGVLALMLLPSTLRPAVRATLPAILRAAAATAVMAAVVWPLRHLLLPIPVLAGAIAFAGVALPARVFPRDEIEMVARLARRAVGRQTPAPAVAPVPVDLSRVALVPAGGGATDDPDTEVA